MLCGIGDAAAAAAASLTRIGSSEELPQIRIGLNSGEVVVRTIDNDLNFDYLAVGDSIHLAARMQELAAPGRNLDDRQNLARSRRLCSGQFPRITASQRIYPADREL